jgi:hypothetical protein
MLIITLQRWYNLYVLHTGMNTNKQYIVFTTYLRAPLTLKFCLIYIIKIVFTTYLRAPLALKSCLISSSTTFLFLLNTKLPKNLAQPLCDLSES